MFPLRRMATQYFLRTENVVQLCIIFLLRLTYQMIQGDQHMALSKTKALEIIAEYKRAWGVGEHFQNASGIEKSRSIFADGS